MMAEKLILFITILSLLSAGALLLFHALMNPAAVIFLSALFLVSLLVLVTLLVLTGKAAAARVLLIVFTICVFVFVFTWIFCILFQKPEAEEIPVTVYEAGDGKEAETGISGQTWKTENQSVMDESESVIPEDEEAEKKEDAGTVGNAFPDTGHETVSTTLLIDNEKIEKSLDKEKIEDVEQLEDVGKEPDIIQSDGIIISDHIPAVIQNEITSDNTAGVAVQTEENEITEHQFSSEKKGKDEIPVFLNVPSLPEISKVSTTVDRRQSQPVLEPDMSEASDSFSSAFGGLSPEEADFWASFYVAGQDELALEDGFYYMDLYINDNITGNIETLVESGNAFISSRELYSYISENVVSSLVDSIFESGVDYISLNSLEVLGIKTAFNSSEFEIRLTFSTSDMPIQILSVRGTPRHSTFHPIAGGIWLDPAVFVLRSNFSFNARLSRLQHFDPQNSMRLSFSSSNTGRLYDLNFNFSYYMNFGADYFDFSLGTYSFYIDFEEPMIRLSFGNVASGVLSPSGRAVGIRFDRSYAYGASDVSRSSQTETLLVVEKHSEVTIFNEGKEIFRRTLDPGRYRLQDFILYTGANEILIRVEPLDGSPAQETVMNVNYSSALIAPGDFYFGGSLVTGRSTVIGNNVRPNTLRIPVGDGEYYEYDWRNITASFYLRTGLSESMSISTSFGIQNIPDVDYAWNPRMKLNTEITHANILGTTRYTLNLDEQYDDNRTFGVPCIYAHIGHQVSTGWTPLSSLSLGFTYTNPQESGREDGHRLSLSTSLSGRFGLLSWSSSFSGTVYTDKMNELSWSQSNTISMNLSRNFWLSGSLMFSGNPQQTNMYGRLYATIRFDGGSVSASSSTDDLSVSASYRTGNHSLSSAFNINNFSDDVSSYSINAGYNYSGKYFNLGASMDSDIMFENTNLQMSLSTSSVFADGMFALGASIPTNFLLIRQDGALKENSLSLGSPGTSSALELDSTFGTYMYTGLSSSRGSAFSLYSTGDDSFSSSGVFDINIPESDRFGYVLRIDADETYSVAGYAQANGTIWSNGSSPVYSYSVDENGNAVLGATDIYVFTDTDGLFVLSGIEEGTYAFDMNIRGEWYLAVFTIESDVPSASVQILTVGTERVDSVLPDVYSGSCVFKVTDILSNDEFWMMIYPEMEVAV